VVLGSLENALANARRRGWRKHRLFFGCRGVDDASDRVVRSVRDIRCAVSRARTGDNGVAFRLVPAAAIVGEGRSADRRNCGERTLRPVGLRALMHVAHHAAILPLTLPTGLVTVI
jgi:hypothetical protein